MESPSQCSRGALASTADEPPSGAVPETVLVLGKADSGAVQHASGCGSAIVLPGLSGLDEASLGQIAPACIVFSLIAANFDASDVLRRLNSLGYAGRACVIAPPLPNQRAVERELRALAPSVALSLWARVNDAKAPQPPQRPR